MVGLSRIRHCVSQPVLPQQRLFILSINNVAETIMIDPHENLTWPSHLEVILRTHQDQLASEHAGGSEGLS